jgi:transmembrane sensor
MAATRDEPAPGEELRAEAAAWLARLRGPSTPEDHAAFEAWYEAAPKHADAYEAVLQSWEAAGLARLTPAGQARSSLRAGRVYRWRYAIAAVAATVVVVLVAFGADGAVFAPNPARTVEFASGAGEIRTIELADGSRITLDAGSLLQTAYSADERRVVLVRGRARFTVAHSGKRPFVVATPVGLVIAHGTVFDVAFDGTRLKVSLLQGSVQVRRAGVLSQAGASRVLIPGQRVIVEGGKIGIPTPASQTDTDWPAGMLSFEDAALGDVVAAANRRGSPAVVLADPSLAKLRFTGTFRAADTEQLAKLIAAMFQLELSRGDGGELVLSPTRSTPDREKIPG